MESLLLESYDESVLKLKNKIVMAPMTRSRADANHIPTDIMIEYYAKRAGAGLIITEGVAPSPNGVGYARIPGIYSREQIEAWKPIAQAVHDNGGTIFMQLMHTGRVSHPDNMPDDSTIFAPSAIAPATTKMYSDQNGDQEFLCRRRCLWRIFKQLFKSMWMLPKMPLNQGWTVSNCMVQMVI